MNQIRAMDTKSEEAETDHDPLALNDDPETDPLGDVLVPCVKPEPIEPYPEPEEVAEEVSVEMEKTNNILDKTADVLAKTADTAAETTADVVFDKSADVENNVKVQVDDAMKTTELLTVTPVNCDKDESVSIEDVIIEKNIKETETEQVVKTSINKAHSPTQPMQSTEKTEIIEQSRNIKEDEPSIIAANEQDPVAMEVDVGKLGEKIETNGVSVPKVQPKVNGSDKFQSYEKLNGDAQKEPSRKRLPQLEEPQSPTKKLCSEVKKDFARHDSIIVDYIKSTTKSNVDEIHQHTEQLLAEIRTLKDLAQKKESEWNHILHLKKVKEEIYQRLLRRKQVLTFEKSLTVNGSVDRATDTVDLPQPKSFTIDKSDDISLTALKVPNPSVSVSAQAIPTSIPHIPPPPAHIAPITTHYNPLPAPPPYDKPINTTLPKNTFPHPIGMRPPSMPMFPVDFNEQLMARYNSQMGRQGPVKDVKSIIADYRQRHPETVPKRGRRMKSMHQSPGNSRPGGVGKMDSLNNLGMLLNNMDVNQKSLYDRLTQMHPGSLPSGVSFKDILVQFANIQQQNAAGLNPAARPQLENIHSQRVHHLQQDAVTVTKTEKERQSEKERVLHPPPYPEISLHPVVSSSNEQSGQNSSLLHGILTKQASATQTFSPTLATLLTSPERQSAYVQAKNCGEITITPVQPKNKSPAPAEAPQPPRPPSQPQATPVQPQEDEESGGGSEGSGEAEGGSRLVIDEGSQEEGVPLCQGCRRRDAQFVCAGCANQWYCSRDCQVAAWDDHSEMCSG